MASSRSTRLLGLPAVAGCAALLLLAIGACGSAGGGGGSGDKTVNVLMVNNSQMVDLQKLTTDNFTKETGIKVNYTVLPENEVRDKISQEFASQAGQYDVATISNYEVPIYSKNDWLAPLDEYVSADSAFDQSDVLFPMTQSLTVGGKLYAEPFYGESSFLMYRKDVLAAKGITVPDSPKWSQVAEWAAKVDGAQPGMKGICLRGLPGWGEALAPLTTVVNTFGGTWFDKDWNAKLTAPEFKAATQFYVDLVRKHGELGAPQSGFTECLTNMEQSKAAMWYDATSAAGSLEADNSPVKGKIGYAAAPTEKTDSAGWLYTWAFAIQKASKRTDNAWKFISWASSKKYEELVGKELGWARVPAGKRTSTYENPNYQKDAAPFYKATQDAIGSANPTNPGVQPRPAPGIQFVGIPEFTDLGTKVSQEISAAIAGRTSVDDALEKSQKLAEAVGKKYAK